MANGSMVRIYKEEESRGLHPSYLFSIQCNIYATVPKI